MSSRRLFTFLYGPGIPATNNFIEAAISPQNLGWQPDLEGRPNPTDFGERFTDWQQGKDAFQQLVTLLRSPQPMLLDLVPASLSP